MILYHITDNLNEPVTKRFIPESAGDGEDWKLVDDLFDTLALLPWVQTTRITDLKGT